MKPPPFEYHAPGTLRDALELLRELRGRAVLLAGGQTLLPLLALRDVHPAHLIDINGVSELGQIRAHDRGLVLGGMVRQRAAERSPLVQERCPLMAEALPFIGHPAIRNRGTIGGSLAHADPAAELPTVIAALEADLVVRSARRQRVLKPDAFFVGYQKTALAPDEILCEVRLAAWPRHAGAAYVNVSRRYGDFALAGVAAVVQLDRSGAIADARLALASVGNVPVRAREAERLLVGQPPGAEVFAAAAERAVAPLRPRSDLHASAAYRRHVAQVLARRSLDIAVQRAEGSS